MTQKQSLSNPEAQKAVFAKYLVPEAVDRIFDFFREKNLQLKIVSPRKGKFGDFSCRRKVALANGKRVIVSRYVISINNDLTPHFFLYVFLHEMAHLLVYEKYGGVVLPHGVEWQESYRGLLQSYRNCFPQEALPLLDDYLASVPLNAQLGRKLDLVLQPSLRPENNPVLQDAACEQLGKLEPNTFFCIADRPAQRFLYLSLRRTRCICRSLENGKDYLVRVGCPVRRIPPEEVPLMVRLRVGYRS